uniref:HK3a n=1 Tax=Arundo donax TaxID=35708 RepID=A0A0A9HJ15_ARUDO
MNLNEDMTPFSKLHRIPYKICNDLSKPPRIPN